MFVLNRLSQLLGNIGYEQVFNKISIKLRPFSEVWDSSILVRA